MTSIHVGICETKNVLPRQFSKIRSVIVRSEERDGFSEISRLLKGMQLHRGGEGRLEVKVKSERL